jgi:hypothetical protein
MENGKDHEIARFTIFHFPFTIRQDAWFSRPAGLRLAAVRARGASR